MLGRRSTRSYRIVIVFFYTSFYPFIRIINGAMQLKIYMADGKERIKKLPFIVELLIVR